MVSDWAAARQAHPGERVVMITDASNHELDRLNQQAQEQRAAAGELGERARPAPRSPLRSRPGGRGAVRLAASRARRAARRERHPRRRRRRRRAHQQLCACGPRSRQPRDVDVNTKELDGLRLAYAQHVYKAQGLTTDRALVLTGGWQTDRERAYVAVSRAREQTDIYAAREDLGHQGIDSDAIDRLAERMSESHAQQASITRAADRRADATRAGGAEFRRAFARRARAPAGPGDRPLATSSERDEEEPRSWFAQQLDEIRSQQAEHARDHDRGEGIEI